MRPPPASPEDRNYLKESSSDDEDGDVIRRPTNQRVEDPITPSFDLLFPAKSSTVESVRPELVVRSTPRNTSPNISSRRLASPKHCQCGGHTRGNV
ncbi:hypothetical protein BDN67DRAFT_976161 [Paxillus ammoniavirescens]|nr:hypothetical protein BDN67DRAFT_976161 [Paxillus ammoniavirescens]